MNFKAARKHTLEHMNGQPKTYLYSRTNTDSLCRRELDYPPTNHAMRSELPLLSQNGHANITMKQKHEANKTHKTTMRKQP